MGKLIFSMQTSLDGYVAGPGGEIDWTFPSEELHRFYNDQVAGLGAYLLGRRLYETMHYWEHPDLGSLADYEIEFAHVWQDLPKIVFSTTLDKVEGNARLRRGGLAEEVVRLKGEIKADLAVGGAGLAASCTELGLIDEYHLVVWPVVLGGGTPYFGPTTRRISLELAETRHFGTELVYLRYVRPAEDVQS